MRASIAAALSLGEPSGRMFLITASSCTGHSATRGGRTISDAAMDKPARSNLSATYSKPIFRLYSGTGFTPVVKASRSTAETISDDGKFKTHSPLRRRFAKVCERVPSPSIQDLSSHHADDTGARFAVPSSLTVLISTTGVPRYKIFGSTTRCKIFITLLE